MEGENVVAGRHATAAVGHYRLGLVHAQRRVFRLKLRRVKEAAIRAYVLGEGRALGAGDVAGARVNGFDLAFVPFAGAGVQDDSPSRRQPRGLLLVYHPVRLRVRDQVARRHDAACARL